MAVVIGIVALLLIGYTYVGYPLLLGLLSVVKRKKSEQRSEENFPALTVVIAVFNGGETLRSKLQSLASSAYPLDKIRVLVVDDGSDDDTVAIAKTAVADLDVTVLSLPVNAGKPSALNAAMQQVDTAITVFMDARQRVDPNCLARLVSRFEDADVGAVSGELVIVDEHNPEQVCVGLYWRYEKWLRERESEIYSTAGATGAVYAIRTELYSPLHADTVLDDFDTPVQILRSGKRVVFEPGAVVIDTSQDSLDDEFQRKLRTLAGNFQSFHRHGWMFRLRENPIFWQFFSHKVLRLAIPWLALLLLLSSAVAAFHSGFWLLMLLLQIVFYTASYAAFVFPQLRESRLLSFALTFCTLNIAAARAPFRYYSGGLDVRWRS